MTIRCQSDSARLSGYACLSACRLTVLLLAFSVFSTVAAVAASDNNFRSRVALEDDAVTEADDVRAEILFGRELAARILGRYQLYQDDKINTYVNTVGKGVALYSSRPELEFKFAVLDTDSVNAFAAPGGYIFITKGALKMMDDESELAAVLSHEVAHVTEKHIVKELNIKGTDSSSSGGLGKMISGGTDTMRAVFTQMVDSAVEMLFEKGLKKQDEFDSDRIGTMIASSVGYDSTALKRYLAKIAPAKEETKILTGTHPSFEERIKSIDAVLAENLLVDKKQPVVKERFNEYVKIK